MSSTTVPAPNHQAVLIGETSGLLTKKPKKTSNFFARNPKAIMLFMSFCIICMVTTWAVSRKPFSMDEQVGFGSNATESMFSHTEEPTPIETEPVTWRI